MKNFINISDLNSAELRSIIEEAKTRKQNRENYNKSSPDKDSFSVFFVLIRLFLEA